MIVSDREVERLRVFRHANNPTIKGHLDHIVVVKYRDTISSDILGYKPDGKRYNGDIPWTVKQMESMVETGHWSVVDKSPAPPAADKPDSNQVAW